MEYLPNEACFCHRFTIGLLLKGIAFVIVGMCEFEADQEKAYWLYDMVDSKIEQLKPFLEQSLNSDLYRRLLSDRLSRKDVFLVLENLFDNSNLLWTSDDVSNAWTKTRNKKNNEFSDLNRNKGNEFIKAGKLTQGFL